VIRPVLFLLFINDLPEEITCECKIFADDTKLFKAVNNEADCNVIQENLDRLQHWSDVWGLKFHPDKCKLLRIEKITRTSTTRWKEKKGKS